MFGRDYLKSEQRDLSVFSCVVGLVSSPRLSIYKFCMILSFPEYCYIVATE